MKKLGLPGVFDSFIKIPSVIVGTASIRHKQRLPALGQSRHKGEEGADAAQSNAHTFLAVSKSGCGSALLAEKVKRHGSQQHEALDRLLPCRVHCED